MIPEGARQTRKAPPRTDRRVSVFRLNKTTPETAVRQFEDLRLVIEVVRNAGLVPELETDNFSGLTV